MIKTLVMEDDARQPMIVLMHGDREVSTKSLARIVGVKTVAPCAPAVADRHSGYQVGGTSPFGTRRAMPVYVQRTIADLPRVYVNGGRAAISSAWRRPTSCASSRRRSSTSRRPRATPDDRARSALAARRARRRGDPRARSSPTSASTAARLAEHAAVDATTRARPSPRRRRAWVEGVRAEQAGSAGVESFLQQYDLSTQEGVLLMCIAEALLRIPDAETADRLIRDKLARGDWEKHLGASESLLVNASTWGLMLTGKLTRIEPRCTRAIRRPGTNASSRAPGEPVVRVALRQAMKVMAEQFVMGRTIAEALARSRKGEQRALPSLVRHAGRSRR